MLGIFSIPKRLRVFEVHAKHNRYTQYTEYIEYIEYIVYSGCALYIAYSRYIY